MVVLLVAAYFLLRAIATAATLDAVAAGLAAGLRARGQAGERDLPTRRPGRARRRPEAASPRRSSRSPDPVAPRPRDVEVPRARLPAGVLAHAGVCPCHGRAGCLRLRPPPIREPRLAATPSQPRQHPRVHVEPADGLLVSPGGHRRPRAPLVCSGGACSHVARLLSRGQGKLDPRSTSSRKLHDPPDRSVSRPTSCSPSPSRSSCRSTAVGVHRPVGPETPLRLPEDRRLGARLPRGRRASWLSRFCRRSTRRPLRQIDVRTCTCRSTVHRRGQAVQRPVTLSWPPQQPAGTRASYAIFRDPTNRAICEPVKHAAADCAYFGGRLAAVGGDITSWADHPPPGTWAYRVSLSATPMGRRARATTSSSAGRSPSRYGDSGTKVAPCLRISRSSFRSS